MQGRKKHRGCDQNRNMKRQATDPPISAASRAHASALALCIWFAALRID